VSRKSPDPAEIADKKLAPAAEEYLQAVADRIGPLAVLAADRLEAAVGRVGPLAHEAAGRVGPLAHEAADRVGPLAQSARHRVAPYVDLARERVQPLATEVGTRVGPVARSAKRRGAQMAHDTVERISPAFNAAVDRVPPAVEAARERVQDDYLPRLLEVLSAAAATPVVAEATKRGKATLAAARGELVLPEPVPEPKPRGRWLKRLLIIGALGGVVVVVVRKLLGSGHQADWQAAQPGSPYVPPKPAAAPAGNGQAPEAGSTSQPPSTPEAPLGTETEPLGTVPVADEPTLPDAADTEANPADAEAQAELGTEEAEVAAADDEVEDGTVPGADRSRFSGEGVYVGTEPPEGYFIKGNERSMKYHLPESSGYSRTIAEVWFNSEEAAQRAGFVRAQR
jgi:hypothetical protein